VADGDVIAVVGATGGVGRLVTERLAALGRFRVRAVVRNPSKAAEFLSGLPDVEVVQGSITDGKGMMAALAGAAGVVCCTGVTAFPSGRWAGGNTPDAVDNVGVETTVRAASEPPAALKRFVLLSSVGVERRAQFPFVILNAFGVLDAKAKGEEAVARCAGERGFSYSILRPGRLVGEPFTNPDMAALTRAEAPGKLMVQMRQGDTLAGDIARGCVAEALVQALYQPGAANKAYTLVNVDGPLPSQPQWDDLFSSV
ncbi:unnamed protein product, partial [Phaeothamnion confervicola]